MEISRPPGQLPPRFGRTSSFRPFRVVCSLPQNLDSMKSESSNGKMFILGMGFVGQFFAADLKTKGWEVTGTCTSALKKNRLEELGHHAYIYDANDPILEILEIVNVHTHLLVSIPPVVGKDQMLRLNELVKYRLKGGNLQWLGYLSSTSVYGDCGGAWVDEDYQPRPTSEQGIARLAAEKEWLNLACDLGISAHIFRLGGIYGPGRSAIDTIIKQEPLSERQRMRTSRHYTSRVHVADICQALWASILKPSPGKIYNVVDDDPAPRNEVFAYAQNLVEEKWPGLVKQCVPPDRIELINPEKGSRGEKRVSNARLQKDLGVKLLHPTYRSGLQSIIEHMERPHPQNAPGA